MKKMSKLLFAGILSIILIFGIVACGSSDSESSDSSSTSAAESFEGTLVDAQGDRIVVRGDTETMLFKTAEQTVYNYGEGDQLSLGDTVQVGYHEMSGTLLADDVTVTQHSKQLLVFGGQISKLTEDSVTVGSGSLTVAFGYDEETKVQGKLAEGNIVTVTYTGDISEDPQAVSIVVTQEKAIVQFKKATGTVAEITDKSVLISVDSAKSYRFKLDKDTKIYGKAKDLRVGDSVGLVYAGDLGKEPLAKTIEVTKLNTAKEYVIDGTITKADKDSITVSTSKNSYKFKVNKKTKISKKAPKVGLITTVTYTGELKKEPVATVIYCSGKEDPKAAKKDKETKKSETKATESKATETKDTETEATETKDTETEATETKDTETETEATETVTEASESVTEATETVTEASETVTEAATEATEATEPPKEPDPEEEIIEADGTIQIWGDKDKTAAIKVANGGTVELTTKDFKIASGYFPQVNDQVRIKYDKVSMALKDIQLIYREADAE